MNIPQQKSLFISFEGSEGSGKSTQITFLTKYLQEKYPAREIVLLREPGGTPLGERIRHLLQYEDSSIVIGSEAELLLFSASRAQLVKEVILPALQRGAIVLCDRFLDSTTVYQGAARSLNLMDVATINHFATRGLLPDITILLDLEVIVGRARMMKRNQKSKIIDRMEQEPKSFYEAVRQGYLRLAMAAPNRWIVVDASGTAEEVSTTLISELEKIFPKLNL